MSDLKFCKVRDVRSPARANVADAGIDFFVPNDFNEIELSHGEHVCIPSGIKVDVPQGWALVMMNKSGIATKRRLLVGACVIDHGYDQEVHLHLISNGNEKIMIKPGDKIVQGVMLQVGLHMTVESEPSEMWVDKIGNREGGFGSTNK